jgi:hypothetical protein
LTLPICVEWIYGLSASDKIASKSTLAYTLRESLPAKVVNAMIPVTYILSDPNDNKKLTNEFDSGKVYLMKKNIQQQNGLVITSDKNVIAENAKSRDYVVIQEMLQDPYMVDGYKINMRVYLLVVVLPNSAVDFYMYGDGFMYYTRERFEKNNTEISKTITTGLSGREMYANKPLTHHDFYAYIGPVKSAKLRENMMQLCSHLKAAYAPIFSEENRTYRGTKFLIYGMDVAPDENLECKLMEVNKGPDLSYKDARDKTLKIEMVNDALSIVGLVPKTESPISFLKVI